MSNGVCRVLLVEDDADDAYLLKEILSSAAGSDAGFAVTVSESLKQGLEALAGGQVDLVIADLTLGDSRGLDTYLKLQSQSPSLPIIVLTGLSDEALALQALQRGAQDYLVKGNLDGRLLRRSIRYAIERRALLARVEEVIAKSADAVVVVDEEGVVRFANPAAEALFALKAEDMIGTSFDYPVSPHLSAEIRITAPGQAPREAEMRVTEMEWHRKPAYLASIRDITELKRVEKLKAEIGERRRLARLKDRFIQAVSGGLKDPLVRLKEELASLEAGTPALRGLRSTIERMVKIVDDVLDLNRLESGESKIDRHVVRAREVLRQTLEVFKSAPSRAEVSLSAKLPEELPDLYGDEERLIQALVRLISHAFQHARSKVLVEARPLETMVWHESQANLPGSSHATASLTYHKSVEITVHDDGPGIPQEQIEGLFTELKPPVPDDRQGGGLVAGLGLALSKEIVERHGGKLWAESSPDQGTRFHIVLPQSSETK